MKYDHDAVVGCLKKEAAYSRQNIDSMESNLYLFLERYRDKLVALADALPEDWEITSNFWCGLAITNMATKRENVAKEELRSVIKMTEMALDVTLTTEVASVGRYLLSSGFVIWPHGNEKVYTSVTLSFYHGDCKIRFEEKTTKVAILDDECLALHGRPKVDQDA